MLKQQNKEVKAIEKRFYKTLIAIPSITTLICVIFIISDMLFNNFDPSEEMFLRHQYFFKFLFLFILTIPLNLFIILMACFGFIIFGLTDWPFASKEKAHYNPL